MDFRIDLTPDDNGTWLVTCPALPEVTTFGATEGACIRNARAAIEEAMAARIASGAEIPPADDDADGRRGRRLVVSMPLLSDLKVELYRTLKATGLTRAELARRLDWNRNSVDRLFKLDHASRLEQLVAAAGALGRKVRAEIVEAD